MEKKNVILADCSVEEIQSFVDGISDAMGESFEVLTSFKKKYSPKSFRGKIKYYSTFFSFAFKAWRKRKNYKMVLGWQQFYAQNFALFSRLFRSKNKDCIIASLNFTYKRKKGLIGKIFCQYMKYVTKRINYLHVLSYEYANRLYQELDVPIEKFVITQFGTPDVSAQWALFPNPEKEKYVLSIGRSNRDFDFLCEVWSQPELKNHRLIILADLWKPAKQLPQNVIHYDNIIGEKSFAYISNAEMSIIPVDDPVICSGDTVLLNSMMMKVPVAVTAPSTLAEMYITDGSDGLFIERDASSAAKKIANVLNNPVEKEKLSNAARRTYETQFSRYAMGKKIGEELLKRLNK